MVESAEDTGQSVDFESLPMRVGLGQFMDPTEERLAYIRQLGVRDINLNMYQYDPNYPHLPDAESMPLEGEDKWSYESLVALRERIEASGLRLNAIENFPVSFYKDIILGGENREEQLENVKTTIRNMGRAGIPIFGYHWMANGVWRTGETKVRGGATATAFDLDSADDSLTDGRRYTEDELWRNYTRFVEETVPVAEEAGIKLCLHPDDPPVEELGGIPRLFRNFENFKRAMDIAESEYHGLEFCLGCWSQIGENLTEVIEYFGERDKLFYVHFRDVEGTIPAFHETFVDEGNYDSYEVMQTLKRTGFSGMMIPDHTPHLQDDTDWEHRGRAHAVGYLQGLLRAVSEDD